MISSSPYANSSPKSYPGLRMCLRLRGIHRALGETGQVNVVKAGQTVPLKWRLTDAAGNPVTTLAAVTVTAVSRPCNPQEPVNPIADTAESNTGLQNLGDGYYQYHWKTPTAYSNQCRELQLDLRA